MEQNSRASSKGIKKVQPTASMAVSGLVNFERMRIQLIEQSQKKSSSKPGSNNGSVQRKQASLDRASNNSAVRIKQGTGPSFSRKKQSVGVSNQPLSYTQMKSSLERNNNSFLGSNSVTALSMRNTQVASSTKNNSMKKLQQSKSTSVFKNPSGGQRALNNQK